MNVDAIPPAIGGGVVTAIIVAAGPHILKLFQAWLGWKKEQDQSINTDLRQMIQDLKTENKSRDEKQAEKDKLSDDRYNKLQKSMDECDDERHAQALQLARYDTYFHMLEKKIRTLDPDFQLKLDGSATFKSLKGCDNGRNVST